MANPIKAFQISLGSNGLTNSSGVLSVSTDNSSIEVSGGSLQIKAGGVTNAMLAEGVLEGLDTKSSVVAGTTAALPAVTYDNGSSGVGATLTADANGALAAQDGVTLLVNERLLVKDQALAEHNGIYSVTQVGDGSNPFILTREIDNDEADQVANAFTFIEEGTTQADTGWVCTTNSGGTMGTTDIDWAQFSAAGVGTASLGVEKVGNDFRLDLLSGGGLKLTGNEVGIEPNDFAGDGLEDDGSDNLRLAATVAGDGLAHSGGVLSVNVDDSGIETNSDTLRLKDNGVTLAKMAGLTSANFILGDASNDPAAVTMSGDATMDNAGAVTIANDAVQAAMLNDDCISGHTELAHADIVDADEMLISDGGTLKRVGVDSLRDHYFGVVSGDLAIADGGAATIQDDAVSAAMVALLDDSLAATDTHFLIADGTDYSSFALSGDVTCSNAGVVSIAADAVEGSMLHSNVVDGSSLEQTGTQLNIKQGGVVDAMMSSKIHKEVEQQGFVTIYHAAGLSDQDTVTIGGQVFTADASPSGQNEFQQDGNAANEAAALRAAVAAHTGLTALKVGAVAANAFTVLHDTDSGDLGVTTDNATAIKFLGNADGSNELAVASIISGKHVVTSDDLGVVQTATGKVCLANFSSTTFPALIVQAWDKSTGALISIDGADVISIEQIESGDWALMFNDKNSLFAADDTLSWMSIQ